MLGSVYKTKSARYQSPEQKHHHSYRRENLKSLVDLNSCCNTSGKLMQDILGYYDSSGNGLNRDCKGSDSISQKNIVQ
jgi:hypothetical protein